MNAPFTWKLVVEYDGTDFSGWQWQTGRRTVQLEMERALGIALERPVRVAGAGRTDAGVHATGQVATLSGAEHDPAIDAPDFLYRLNSILADDVSVRAVTREPPWFHARFSAVRRHYLYRLSRTKPAIERRNTVRVRGPFDAALLAEAAARLPGHRDYSALGMPTDKGGSTLCRLETVRVVDYGDLLILEVSANRFLRKMVRTMTGALLEVARRKRPVEWIDELLESRDRKQSPAPVAARGLTLVGVEFREPPSRPEG